MGVVTHSCPKKCPQGSLLSLPAQAALAGGDLGLLGSWVHLCTLFGQEKHKEERWMLFQAWGNASLGGGNVPGDAVPGVGTEWGKPLLFPGSPWSPCTSQSQGCLQVLQPSAPNPVMGMGRVHGSASPDRVLSPSEVSQLLAALGHPPWGSLSSCSLALPGSWAGGWKRDGSFPRDWAL